MNVRSQTNLLRRGFTLIELLVVIAIIAILIALLLPAIQKVREAANRMKCQNNLKQMGIALHMHNDNIGRLPPGCAADAPPFGTGASNWGSSWLVYILPYLEQSSIYDKWTFSGGSGYQQGSNAPVIINTVLQVYLCPSSPFPAIDCGTAVSGGTTVMRAQYTGIAGAVGNIPGYNETRVSNSGNQNSAGGVLFPNSQVRLTDITDGTSNVMMVSEQNNYIIDNTGAKQRWNASGPHGWAMGSGSSTQPPAYTDRPFNTTTIRYTNNFKGGWSNGGCCNPANGVGDNMGGNIPLTSAHTGGVNVLLGDGSVRFLTDSIPLATLSMLATRDDGIPVPAF